MRTFLLIWFGQAVSLLGSSLTEFALGVWVYQSTGSIAQFAFVQVFNYLPRLIFSPFAGPLVDRWNRRWAMILSDSVTGVAALIVMALIRNDSLEVWHIYLGVAVSSAFNSFQWPAYMAAIGQVVPKEHLSRANGMSQVSKATAKILGPTLAGVLVVSIGINNVLVIDFVTFVFALGTLAIARFPDVEHTPTEEDELAYGDRATAKVEQLWQEMTSGWNYIVQRSGLLKLTLFLGITYLSEGILQVVFWPLILSLGSSQDLGFILSIGGCGMLFGSVAVSAWAGPKRRVYGIFAFVCFQGICLCFGGLQNSIVAAGIAAFGYLFARPFVLSFNHTIWHNKIPIKLQGRVFALQRAIECGLMILTYLSAGPLVDGFFEPMMAEDGLLANTIVGRIVGVGDGRGIALFFALLGIMNIVAVAIAYRTPRLRRVEKELPDAIGLST
jgi:MFS family permease